MSETYGGHCSPQHRHLIDHKPVPMLVPVGPPTMGGEYGGRHTGHGMLGDGGIGVFGIRVVVNTAPFRSISSSDMKSH